MSFLDLILIAFLLYMFFSGYSKVFFSTLYDLVSFMIMMLFIFFNVETISSIIQIYKPVDDPLSQLGGSVINMLIVFIIMFVVLEIIRRLIGVLIKPLVNQLTDHFALTAFCERIGTSSMIKCPILESVKISGPKKGIITIIMTIKEINTPFNA